MIPATQRPDGTWRKARRTRQESGSDRGSRRYIPPALRSVGCEGSREKSARSLGDVGSRRPGSSPFLDAVIFLLTAATSAVGAGEGCVDAMGREQGSALRAADVGSSVATAAQETIFCGDCRKLRDESAAAAAAAAVAKIGEDEVDGNNDAMWWARLRQVEQGRRRRSKGGVVSEVATTDSWVGLELKLRRGHISCPDGQAAIVDFLKGSVSGAGRLGAHGESGAGSHANAQRMLSADTGQASREVNDHRSDDDDRREGQATARKHDQVAVLGQPSQMYHQPGREQGSSGATASVLIFGTGLSKRDRADFHHQAEMAGGVASSSHGVGDARFLALACGLGDGAAADDYALSVVQAARARRLFRLAQEEYHSRYERFSHREIREVVATGGPNAHDHPDLFRLLEKNDAWRDNSARNDTGDGGDTNAAKAARLRDLGTRTISKLLCHESQVHVRFQEAAGGRAAAARTPPDDTAGGQSPDELKILGSRGGSRVDHQVIL